MAGYLSRKQGDVSLAIDRFSTCLESSSQFFEIENIGKYEIGWGHYLNNSFEAAKDLFEEFLSNHRSNTYKAWCYWQLACGYYYLGDSRNALEGMKSVGNYKRNHYSWDEFAYRKSKSIRYKSNNSNRIGREYQKQPGDLEMKLFKVYNLISTNSLESAGSALELLVPELKTSKDHHLGAYATYLKGKLQAEMGNETAAGGYFNEVIDMKSNIKREKYLVAYSYYQILKIKLVNMESELQTNNIEAKILMDSVNALIKGINFFYKS